MRVKILFMIWLLSFTVGFVVESQTRKTAENNDLICYILPVYIPAAPASEAGRLFEFRDSSCSVIWPSEKSSSDYSRISDSLEWEQSGCFFKATFFSQRDSFFLKRK